MRPARARDATVIAGGTTVMPRVQAGDSGIGALVSLGRLKLDLIAVKGERITIGAATTLGGSKRSSIRRRSRLRAATR